MDRHRPLYARVLRLDHLRPGGLLCFLFFEGMIALAVLMSLAELVNWWSVLVLPTIVAGLVKINDLVAGMFAGTERARSRVRGVAHVEGISGMPTQVISLPAARREEVGTTRSQRRRVNQRRFTQTGWVRSPEPPKSDW